MLDDLADRLEAKGYVKEATELDVISNTIAANEFSRSQPIPTGIKWERVEMIDGARSPLSNMWGIVGMSNGRFFKGKGEYRGALNSDDKTTQPFEVNDVKEISDQEYRRIVRRSSI